MGRCYNCSGYGYTEESCGSCSGTGHITYYENGEYVRHSCNSCYGRGQIKNDCSSCGGSGETDDDR
ncbi:MAG: hypothetical protein LUG51_11325 [Tannerellaceae bacterium]|nr:hypothetical protein [Tannerellaceae bacterium]